MGEARKRQERLKSIGPTTYASGIDFSGHVEKIEAMIDTGQVEGLVVLHKIKTPVPGVFNVGLVNAIASPQDCFDMLCTMRRSMMETMGFTDPEQKEDKKHAEPGKG